MARREEANKEEKVVVEISVADDKKTHLNVEIPIADEKATKLNVEIPIAEEKKIKLNLGCGYRKIGEPDWINIDNRSETEPDMVLDITKGLPFEDNSIDEVKTMDFLEHVPIGKTIFVMEEIYRVLKNGGRFESITPSTDGRGAFQDPFHVSFWNANSFLYFCDPDHRGLYGIKANFIGDVNSIVTNKQLNIIHVHAILFANKE